MKSDISRYLVEVAPFNRHDIALREKCALMVIDMQRFFLHKDAHAFLTMGQAILDNVKMLIDTFRTKNKPVIYTCHVHDPNLSDAGIMGEWWRDMICEGTAHALIHEAISPLPGEKIVYKHRYSAFYNTDLETVLRVLKVEDIVISGVMTNLCCESTARDAFYRDYRVHFLADATGAATEEMHRASLLNLAYGFARVTTTGKILAEV